MTPLSLAANNGHEEIVLLLLNGGAVVDVNDKVRFNSLVYECYECWDIIIITIIVTRV
jgi:ankyrin repeat protein